MQKVLISGSRFATPEMLEIVRIVVAKLWWGHHEILVGDAIGIDAEVVKQCESLAVPYIAYGIAKEPRNRAANYISIRNDLPAAKKPYAQGKHLYAQRDQWMVDRADRVICISNTPLTPGTLAVYRYATAKGKPAILRTALNERKILIDLIDMEL